MNAESFNPAREYWVNLDSVENVEGSVPVVRVLAEIKVNCAEDVTESDIASRWKEDTKSHVRRKYRGMKLAIWSQISDA